MCLRVCVVVGGVMMGMVVLIMLHLTRVHREIEGEILGYENKLFAVLFFLDERSRTERF